MCCALLCKYLFFSFDLTWPLMLVASTLGNQSGHSGFIRILLSFLLCTVLSFLKRRDFFLLWTLGNLAKHVKVVTFFLL